MVAFFTPTSSGSESLSAKSLTVNLSAVSAQTVTVAYSVSGTATGLGTDYNLANGTLTFVAGEASKTIIIDSIVDDVLDETNETIIVTLSAPTNATLGTNSAHSYTITDDDSAPMVAFFTPTSNGLESKSAANLTVNLSAVSAQTVTVAYSVSGTATGLGTDYSLASGTLTFLAGESSKDIIIGSIVDDLLDEADETVIVTLSAPINASLGTNSAHSYTITDDDSAPMVAFFTPTSSGLESQSTKNLTVNLSAASAQTVTVAYSVSGTATGSGTDYSLANGTLTFVAGEASKTITIGSIVDDVLDEANETIIVTLSAPTNAALGINATHSYTITDNDTTAIALTIQADEKTKIVGDADPNLSYQLISGSLEDGDALTGSLSRAAGETAGSYVINQGSVQANDKYLITYISAALIITSPNNAPIITGSPAITVKENSAYSFTPTVTDADDSDSKTFSIINKPSWASFDPVTGALIGTPTSNHIGITNGIVISVKDNSNASASLSSFNLEVISANEAPIANNVSVEVAEDSEIAITLEGSDADNDQLTFVITQQPTHGSLSLSSTSAATWLYQADENYHGVDEFSYQVKDTSTSSESAFVSINVTPVNDQPLAENDNVTVAYNDSGHYSLDVLANDSDIDGDTLSIVSASVNIGEVEVENNQLVYKYNGAIDGAIELSYLIDDGSGSENSRAKAAVKLLITDADNTQLPIITLPADIEYNATALFTKIDLGIATAIDKNGQIVPVSLVDGISMFKPGNSLVYWQAVDENGLEQTATQKVKVRPLITIDKDAVGAEGQHYNVGVYLNGTAPDYPVVIPYTVSGSADENDHLLTSGELVITQGTEGVIEIETLVDNLDESTETVIITLGGDKNYGTKSQFTLTITEENIAPELSYSVRQNDEQRLLVEANSADVVIQSMITDANTSDSHTYLWQSHDGLLNDIDINEDSFTFATSELAQGIYQVTLTVTDDGVPMGSTSATIYLEVTAQLATLTDNDSDGDLIPDHIEGFSDTDLDGIPDYLDGDNPCNVMPEQVTNSQLFLVEGESGVCLRKGLTVANNESGGIQLQDAEVVTDQDAKNVGGLFDFAAYGLPLAGQSYNVVLPQRLPIPEGAIYRKYTGANGWVDFFVDDKNYYSSSPGVLGFCPPPLDATWVKGLAHGDWCVQVTIEDGGPNDDDGQANNTIVDPGGVAVTLSENHQPSITSRQLTLTWNTSVSIDVLSDSTDIDGDLLTISSANVDFGEVLIEGEKLFYTPADSFVGTALILFGVEDNHGGTAYGTVEIQVNASQAAPVVNETTPTINTKGGGFSYFILLLSTLALVFRHIHGKKSKAV